MLICPSCKTDNPINSKYCRKCGIRLVSLPDTGTLIQGTVLNKRYRIIKKIGQGAMGAIYQVSDSLSPNSIWAVKEISESQLSPTERTRARENFKREAEILSKLEHPNIPKVIDFFSENGKTFFVMEFIAGQNLEDMLLNIVGYFSEKQVIQWIGQVCDALAFIHSQNPPIIFRDVKPSNIMVDKDGVVKLVDFGIARFFNPNKADDTEELGTPSFASLEQYGKGQSDIRSDIYGLGATLYFMLTKNVPIEAVKRIGLPNDPLIPPKSINPDISTDVEKIILKALALNPDDRFQSALELKEALFNAVGIPIQTTISQQIPTAQQSIFTFPSLGLSARTIKELVNICDNYRSEGVKHLINGDFELWLTNIGRSDLAQISSQIRTDKKLNKQEKLEKFLMTIDPTLSPPTLSVNQLRFSLTLVEGTSKTITIKITNVGRGYLSGRVIPNVHWIRNTKRKSKFGCFPGKITSFSFNITTKSINPKLKLNLNQLYTGNIEIDTNVGKSNVTVLLTIVKSFLNIPQIKSNFTTSVNKIDFGVMQVGSRGKKIFTISSKSGLLQGNISCLDKWITISPNNFNAIALTVTVEIDTITLPLGAHNTSIEITTNQGTKNIPVDVIVSTKPSITPSPQPSGLKNTIQAHIKKSGGWGVIIVLLILFSFTPIIFIPFFLYEISVIVLRGIFKKQWVLKNENETIALLLALPIFVMQSIWLWFIITR